MRERFSRQAFARLIRDYRPSVYEHFGEAHPSFSMPMHHALKCRDRFYAALRSGLRCLPDGSATIVDFGPFPGSLLRLLRALDVPGTLKLIGAGLMTRPDFIQFMKTDCGAEIVTVNLDPMNRQFDAKGYPVHVPMSEGSAHLGFALEIIEHLSSPFHLIQEAFKVLTRGGHLVLTTPNVTRIGNIFKMTIGRSPNDRLAPLGYDNPEDEWQPHVCEYTMAELAAVVESCGFEVVERRFFLGEDTRHCVQPMRQRFVDLAKLPFYAVPHFRGSLLLVGRKPC
jgi:SAM-dependent methyltransferase